MKKNKIFTTSFHSGSRTYFLDIKESKDGDKYVVISESKFKAENEFDRHNIIVFQEDVEKFANAVAEIAQQIKNSKNQIMPLSFEEIRKKHPKAYAPWTPEDDHKLELLYCEGRTAKELSEIFGRKSGAINSRIKKLELKEKYGTK